LLRAVGLQGEAIADRTDNEGRPEKEHPMSTTTQTFPMRERRVSFAALAAIDVSLALGAAGGSVIMRTIDRAARTTASPAGWDVQKLEAMQGRQLAAALAERGMPGWDPQKLAAMQGRQRAEAIRLAASVTP
jgi:hypothetical protein